MKTSSLIFIMFILLFLVTGCSKETTTPSATSWKTLASMPTARQNFGFVVCNNLLYAVGGYNANGLSSVEVYDPAKNTWETKASMHTPRGYLVVASVHNKIYAIGGITGSDLNNITYTNVTEEYDPATDKWITKSPLPITAQPFNSVLGNEFITGAAIGDKVYVVGGNSDVSVPTYIYDPISDSWSQGAEIGKFNLEPYFSTTTNTDLYVTDGHIFMQYISAADQWRTLQPASDSIMANCLCAYKNSIYSIGGYSTTYIGNNNYSISTSNIVEVYNISNASWANNPLLNIHRHSASGAVYNDNLYVAGGANKQMNYTDVPLGGLEVLALK